MDARKETPGVVENRHESDFAAEREERQTLSFPPVSRGQSCPQHCPYRESRDSSALGEAMSIGDVARMLGCSVWTVRQKYLPQGLPHVRASEMGKIVFLKTQVIAWIVKRQQLMKGGTPR
jgi:hypothetical protein